MSNDVKWVWFPDPRFSSNHWVEFRQTIELDRVGHAVFIIAADTAYQLWINEQRVDDAYFSEFPADRYYHAIDVSSYLKKGNNCVAILGYYQGISTSRYVAGKPGILFELQQDGRGLLKSNAACRARTSRGYLSGRVPLVTTQLGPTLQYDASLDDGWKGVDYDDSAWGFSHEIASAQEFSPKGLRRYPLKRFTISFQEAHVISSGILENVSSCGTPAELIQASILREDESGAGELPIHFAASPDGRFALFDLSQASCGYLQIELEASEVTIIDIAHGEHLTAGRVLAKIEERNFADRYVARKGYQIWSMPVRKLGGRYLELHIRNKVGRVKVRSIGLNVVEYPTRSHSGFRCSDGRLEKIMAVSQKTAKLCMLEHYSDTPWREQALYSLDAAIQALCGYYLFGDYEYAEKSLRMLGQGKFCDQYLAICAPSELDMTIPSFTMMWIVAVRDFTLFSGRFSLAQEHFSYIERFIFGRLNQLDEGVLKLDPSKDHWNFYEWSSGLDGGGPYQEDTAEYHSCQTLFLLKAIHSYNDICGYLEKGRAVEQRIISKITERFHQKFYCEEKGLYANEYPFDSKAVFSELTQDLACTFMNLGTEQSYVAQERMGAKTALVPATLSMSKYVFSALDILLDDDGQCVLDRIRRDWGFMISQGATSFWETLDGAAAFQGAGSLCHGWSIVPVSYIYSEILGIKPLKPGFKQFEVSPKFADLSFIQGRIPTPRGDIRIRWKRKGNEIDLEIEYPAALELIDKITRKHKIILKTKTYEQEAEIKI